MIYSENKQNREKCGEKDITYLQKHLRKDWSPREGN